jgi:hypothetical protein
MTQHQDLGILPPRLTTRQTQQRHSPGNNQEEPASSPPADDHRTPDEARTCQPHAGHETESPMSRGICAGGTGFRHPQPSWLRHRSLVIGRETAGRRPADRSLCVTDNRGLSSVGIWPSWQPGVAADRRPWPAAQACDMGVQIGFAGVQVGPAAVRDHESADTPRQQIAFLHVKAIRFRCQGAWMLEIDLGAVAHRAMWGYGVDPPSLWNPCNCLVRTPTAADELGRPRMSISQAARAV